MRSAVRLDLEKLAFPFYFITTRQKQRIAVAIRCFFVAQSLLLKTYQNNQFFTGVVAVIVNSVLTFYIYYDIIINECLILHIMCSRIVKLLITKSHPPIVCSKNIRSSYR